MQMFMLTSMAPLIGAVLIVAAVAAVDAIVSRVKAKKIEPFFVK